jgi:release factor glutamine methyltransferase
MTNERSVTLLEVLQSTTTYFKKHQIDNPRLNAEHLLAHALGQSRMELYLDFARPLTETELVPLRDLVRRRGEGEPLQHLLDCGVLRSNMVMNALSARPNGRELVELVAARRESRIENCRC